MPSYTAVLHALCPGPDDVTGPDRCDRICGPFATPTEVVEAVPRCDAQGGTTSLDITPRSARAVTRTVKIGHSTL